MPRAPIALAAFALIAGCGDSTTTSEKKKAPEPPFVATTANVRKAFEDELGKDVDGLPRIRAAKCVAGRCMVAYNADEPVFTPEKTILEAQRPVWKKLFSDRRFKQATMTAWGETVTKGGKTGQSAVLRITCDRQANEQIAWDNVDVHGMKELCDYQQLVGFD